MLRGKHQRFLAGIALSRKTRKSGMCGAEFTRQRVAYDANTVASQQAQGVTIRHNDGQMTHITTPRRIFTGGSRIVSTDGRIDRPGRAAVRATAIRMLASEKRGSRMNRTSDAGDRVSPRHVTWCFGTLGPGATPPVQARAEHGHV
jgi:hypothetical protein